MALKRRYSDHEFELALASSKTIAEVLIKLKLTVRPGNYRTFWRNVARLGLRTTHLDPKANLRGKDGHLHYPLNEVFVADSPYSNAVGIKEKIRKKRFKSSHLDHLGVVQWEHACLGRMKSEVRSLPPRQAGFLNDALC